MRKLLNFLILLILVDFSMAQEIATKIDVEKFSDRSNDIDKETIRSIIDYNLYRSSNERQIEYYPGLVTIMGFFAGMILGDQLFYSRLSEETENTQYNDGEDDLDDPRWGFTDAQKSKIRTLKLMNVVTIATSPFIASASYALIMSDKLSSDNRHVPIELREDINLEEYNDMLKKRLSIRMMKNGALYFGGLLLGSYLTIGAVAWLNG